MARLRNPHPGEILKEEFLTAIGMSQKINSRIPSACRAIASTPSSMEPALLPAIPTCACGLRPRQGDGSSHNGTAHVAFGSSDGLGPCDFKDFVAQSHTPNDHCVRFANGRHLPRRNTRYRAGATPFPDRTFTGWTAPASPGAPLRLHCEGLSPSTPCRSPGAHWLRFVIRDRTASCQIWVRSPWACIKRLTGAASFPLRRLALLLVPLS